MIELKDVISIGKGSPVNINWELVSHCQFQCTYCYYKPFTSDTKYTPLSKIILKKIEKVTDDTQVTLLGGEPSLHPSFVEVVSSLYKMDHVKKIHIVTNAVKPISFWNNLAPFSDKLKIVFSYHPEFTKKNILEKINDFQSSFDFDIVFIVHNQIEFLEKMKEDANFLLNNIDNKTTFNIVKIHDESGNDVSYRSYPSDTIEFISNLYKKINAIASMDTVNIETNSGYQTLNKFDVVESGLNKLKGWNCELRAFTIHEDGMVTRSCTNEKKHILVQDFSMKTLKCPYQLCECDDYWEFPKKRNS